MKITKLEQTLSIDDNELVRCKTMGNIVQIMSSQKRSKGGYIIKKDKDHYIDKQTGELKEFIHIENRSQDLNNVAKSLSMGRDILNTNVTDVSKCRWITLTYKENMTNPTKLQNDFKKFNTRCRKIFGHYEYITFAEPQQRGAWHLHFVAIFDNKAPYMKNEIVADCWKRGFVTVKRLDDVDNVGAYLTAYLADMDLDEFCNMNNIDGSKLPNNKIKNVDVVDDNGKHLKKSYVKGGRLWMYPAGFHIFRCSKGIKKPIVENMSYGIAKKEKVSSAKLTFSKTILLSDDATEFSNVLNYEYYNKIRK